MIKPLSLDVYVKSIQRLEVITNVTCHLVVYREKKKHLIKEMYLPDLQSD